MKAAVVLLSGGLDSMVCAAIARERGYSVVALTVDYNQRHRVELDAARSIAALLADRHIVLPLDLRAFGGSALTSDVAVPKDGAGEGIPVTYVPARNTIFLSLALGLAEANRARDIFIGVNALDYSGYPDCRPEFIREFERVANLATKAGVEGEGFTIHAPLQHLSKAEIAREAARLGLDAALSHSCYDPLPDGRHCGRCDACRLRAKGFVEAGLADPTAYAPLGPKMGEREEPRSGEGSPSPRASPPGGGRGRRYAVKECFLTLQGEGVQSGSRAVFLRFAGCNLWSGREADRAGAQCSFCDTDFVGTDGEGGGKFSGAEALAEHVEALWGQGREERLVVITGGEPMLQLDAALVDALHVRGFRIAMESNGTLPAAEGLDWICISPKAGTDVVQRWGNELKLVWPQEGIDPTSLEEWVFDHFLVQPMDCADREAAVEAAVRLAMERPKWRLSLQAHKVVGLA